MSEQIELNEEAVIAYLKSKGMVRVFGLTIAQIGKHFNKTAGQISRYLFLLHREGKINRGIINGQIRYSHIN